MAAGHGNGGDSGGSMDITQHLKAWKGFTAFVKWAIIGIIIIMFLLLIFRTHG